MNEKMKPQTLVRIKLITVLQAVLV